MSLNKQEGFEIISKMINSSRQKITDNSFFFLLWGWTVFVAALLQYVLFSLEMEMHYLPWIFLTTAATISHILYGLKHHKGITTKTYLDDFLKIMWMSIWVVLALGFPLIVFMANFKTAYMFIILLYSLGSFITGVLIKFKPLFFGAIISALCCINFAFWGFPEVLLIMAVSILFTYIIPGHLLKRRNNGI